MAGEGKFIDGLMKGDVIISGYVDADNSNRVLKEDFKSGPIMSAVLGSAATATSASVMLIGVNTFLTTPIVGQTKIAPVIAATGLDVSGDQTANDGREIDFSGAGVLGALSDFSYTVGKAFYGKLSFSIADVSGTDSCMFGFRKAAAHSATAAYTDMATLNAVSGDIKIITNLNSGGATTTDTTDNWADTESHELAVFVSDDGEVTYTIDGAAPTVTAEETLDTDDVFIPFFQFLQDTDLSGAIVLESLECGLQ